MGERPPRRQRWRVASAVGAIAFGLAPLAAAGPALAAEGNIDHVEPGEGGAFQVLYSLPGGTQDTPDLDSIDVTLDDLGLPATGEIAADAGQTVQRTAILAVDVSGSMGRGDRIEGAKLAAQVFLDNAPDDLYIGIVTFAGEVTVAQAPSLDRDASSEVIDGLTLSKQTHLYDGVIQAVQTAGLEGSRSLLVLSDGRDTSKTAIEDVTDTIEEAGVKVDVVALSQGQTGTDLLTELADAGNGSVINADDPEALAQVFADEAQTLASQVLITVEAPSDLAITEGTLAVSMSAGAETFTDTAFVTVATTPTEDPSKATDLIPAVAPNFEISRSLMLGALAAMTVGVLIVLVLVVGGLGSNTAPTLESRISAYTRKGSRNLNQAAEPTGQGVTAQAVGVAERALEANKGIEAAVGGKLEAAGMSLKPAEWLLAHAAIAVLSGIMALLLTSGNIFWGLGGLLMGTIAPWFYLSFRTGRRIKRFRAQLADTLQLMAGSLSAGLSLAQSVDTVVREGSDPISGEFRRALVEARLGVQVEDALEGIADRMGSRDFEWVVMAIRIQREVGGNLSELLNSVANTIREREYLERQILALSAEGRLSVWILGGLPPAFLGYLVISSPEYLEPLISTRIGYVLLFVMTILLVTGIVWMKKLTKVDV